MVILASVLLLSQPSIVGDWEGRVKLDRKSDPNPQIEKVYKELDAIRISLKFEKGGAYTMSVPRSMLGPARNESGNWFRTGYEIALMPKSKTEGGSNVLKVTSKGDLLEQSLGTDGAANGKLVFARKTSSATAQGKGR